MVDLRALVRELPAGAGRVHVEVGDISWIRLDHPATRNALDPAMMVAFADAVEAVRGARVVILTGEAGAFCSGGNLGAVREHLAVAGAGASFGAFMQQTVDRLAALDAIVIAAVEGPALGGGAELVTAADVVIAGPTARFGFVHARLGVSPGFGGGARLVRRVGPTRALHALAFARTWSAADALAAGLADELHADPRSRAVALAHELLPLPEAAVRGAKRLVLGAAPLPAHEEELRVFDALWGGDAHLAALDGRRRS